MSNLADDMIQRLQATETEEEWDEALKGMTDDELIAYFERFRQVIADNREAFPGVADEMIEEMAAKGESFLKSVREEKIAQRELAISTRRLEHSADSLLRALPDKGKGN